MLRSIPLLLIALVCIGCSSDSVDDPTAANQDKEVSGDPTSVTNTSATKKPVKLQEPTERDDEPEIRSRIGRSILDALDEEDSGTDEEHDAIKGSLRENDKVLRQATGKRARDAILNANNPHRGPRKIVPPSDDD